MDVMSQRRVSRAAVQVQGRLLRARRAQPEDAAAVAALIDKLSGSVTVEGVERVLLLGWPRVLVAERMGEVVAVAVVEATHPLQGAPVAHLTALASETGLAFELEALVEEASREARRLGCLKLRAEVQAGSEGATALLSALGFEAVSAMVERPL